VDAGDKALAWQVDPDALQGGTTARSDTDVAHFGTRSFLIDSPSPGSALAASGTVELRVGRVYRLSGWIRARGAKSDPTSRYPTAVPACLSMESFPFTNHSPAIGGDSDWTQVETLFVATRSRDRVRLHLGHNGTASGKAWFDDIRLEEAEDISAFIPMETVRWFRDGYRYDDRGWIFMHVEGAPYERGYQYGTLVANEIVEYITKLAIQRNAADPAAGWKALRFESDALFLRGYDEEYLTEMKGIADGAANAKAKYDGRPLDLLDIVTINSAIDLGQLHDAMQVTPHGLSGESFLAAEQEMQIKEENHKCSAFAATGPATADGQVVFGQLFMWSGYTGVHWNVICDLQPTSGHRLVYQTFPGGIHSGADFYINSAGIVIGETTVAQTPYKPDSIPQSSRIRRAAQYASSIDDVERILWQGNNGMYTNDWPIADIKTGEVAVLLLGTHRKKLWRTGEDPSPFGTPGFLWANNNNRDDEVRKEYVAQPEDRPFDLVFSAWNRDVAFNEFYQQYKGRIDSTVAVRMWASSPLNRAHACDGKITTTEMARELAFLAHYGKVTLREKFPQKDQRIMPDLPGAIPHLSLGYSVASPIFVSAKLKEARDAGKWRAVPKQEEIKDDLGDLAADLEIDRDQLWRRTVYP
ncbi:MAG: C45 family autoproteolytic acyltransferase/hydrolase, partial [Phycisphaerales bacterium]|nr:C45 family autoproteolytic acyltransferase/hydrolase [Phycisphaerales bacterium]